MPSIYLDYAATTPIDPRVAAKMQTVLAAPDLFGNPHASHGYGKKAISLIEEARFQVASLIHASPDEIIWTSGATESINLALKGAASLYQKRGQHVITMQTEHAATLASCEALEKSGYRVTYLPPLSNGLLDPAQLKAAISEDTILVSILHVNNETGVIQDLKTITDITTKARVLLHVDAAQSIGKLDLNLETYPIDLLSLSAHKTYGPKGIGALYLRKRPRVRVAALLHGGGHEQGMRSGTLPTHQIVGMGEAYRLVAQENKRDFEHAKQLQHTLLKALKASHQIQCHTDLSHAVPHILSIGFLTESVDTLLSRTPHLLVSKASACKSHLTTGSHVLRAMGIPDTIAENTLRFSFGRFTTLAEIEAAVACLCG